MAAGQRQHDCPLEYLKEAKTSEYIFFPSSCFVLYLSPNRTYQVCECGHYNCIYLPAQTHANTLHTLWLSWGFDVARFLPEARVWLAAKKICSDRWENIHLFMIRRCIRTNVDNAQKPSKLETGDRMRDITFSPELWPPPSVERKFMLTLIKFIAAGRGRLARYLPRMVYIVVWVIFFVSGVTHTLPCDVC